MKEKKKVETKSAGSNPVQPMVSHEPLFLKEAIKILGWQGGTIHQVLEVLHHAKMVSDQYHESTVSGDWELMGPRITSLRYVIHG